MCKQRLLDQYIQSWRATLEVSKDAQLYKLFKTEFITSAYLSEILIKKHRLLFCKFICRNYNLKVITGRWHKPNPLPFNERKCDVCNSLEDEFHYIFECVKYADLRKKYIKKYFYTQPSMYKLIELLSCNNKKVLRNLAKYMYEASLVSVI